MRLYQKLDMKISKVFPISTPFILPVLLFAYMSASTHAKEWETPEEKYQHFLGLYEDAKKRNATYNIYRWAQFVGHALKDLGRIDEAEDYYEGAMVHWTEHVQNLIQLRIKQKNLKGSKEWQKRLAMDDISQYASSNLQSIYLYQGKMAKAQAVHRRERDYFVRFQLDQVGAEWRRNDLEKFPLLNEHIVPNFFLVDNEVFYFRVAGRTQEALDISTQAVTIMRPWERRSKQEDKDFYDALNSTANLWEDIGNLDEVIALREEMVTKPVSGLSNYVWHRNLSQLQWLKDQRYGSDAEHLESALEALAVVENWHDQTARLASWLDYARMLAIRGRFDEALSYIDKSRKLAEEIAARTDIINADFALLELQVMQSNTNQLSEERFEKVLEAYRQLGYKNREPFVYAVYADYLKLKGDAVKALQVTDLELQMMKSYGWTCRIPMTMIRKANLYLMIGDIESAEALWREILAYVKDHPEIPEYLKQRIEHARTAFINEKDRILKNRQSKALVEWKAGSLEAASDADVSAETKLAGLQIHTPSILMQPLEIRSEVAVGEVAGGRVTLSNISELPITGVVQVDGRHTPVMIETWDAPSGVMKVIVGDGTQTKQSQEMTLQPEEQVVVYLEAQAVSNQFTEIDVQWLDPSLANPLKHLWKYRSSDILKNIAVVNTNIDIKNAFMPVIMYQEVFYRERESIYQNYRFRTTSSGRIEIIDDVSRELIAVDANGDGDFEDVGDILNVDQDRDGYPDIPLDKDNNLAAIEVLFYEDQLSSDDVELVMEMRIDGQWQEEAINIIR